MPTVLRIGNIRFHFYSDEKNEPPHIHAANADGECTFWLEPVRLSKNRGMRPLDVRKIEKMVFEHRRLLLEKFMEWQEQR